MKVKRMKYVNKYNLPIDSIYYDTTELSEYKFEQHIFCDDVQNEEFATLFWILLYFYSNQTLFPFTYFDGSNLRIIEIESDKIDIYSLSCKLQEEIAYGNNVYCDGNDIPIVFTFDTTAYTELKKSNTIMVINIDFKSREKIKIYYNKYLFFRETIERFEDNLIYIWMQQRYNKNIFIEEIDPVCKAEKRLLRSFNNKIFDWNTEETFLETFLRHLERFADNRAYVEGEYVLTYRRLNQMANYWAKQLLGASNDYIGIYMKSDIATVVAILAILKAGKIIVTINPSYPVQRIRDIIAQLNITTLLTCNQTFLCAVEEKFVCDTFIIDMNNMPVDDYGEEINCIRKPDDICYVVYTSGTTGVPKGVMISHRNIMIELKFAKHFFGYNQSTHSLHMLNYSFDFGLFDFLINLYSGSCLYSLDKTRMKSFKDYIQFIGDNYIENINTTPTFFSIIASFKKRLSSLKVVHLGGEKVTYEMINKYYEILDDECTVYNGYGPCEVTIGSAIHPVTLREREKSNQVVENVPIGPPTDDSYMYVLNKNHKMVPINALGELYVGGKGVGLV